MKLAYNNAGMKLKIATSANCHPSAGKQHAAGDIIHLDNYHERVKIDRHIALQANWIDRNPCR